MEVAAAQVMAIEEAMKPNGDVQTLDLTPDQKITIYREAREKKSRVAPTWFTAQVGAVVPPMIALYPLPDTILHSDPITRPISLPKWKIRLWHESRPKCVSLP